MINSNAHKFAINGKKQLKLYVREQKEKSN